MGNFLKKLFWDSEEKIAPPPPPVFLLEDLTPNRSIWSFYKKKEEKDSINIIADLTIGKRPFTDTYKSDVRFDKINDHIHVTNIDGPLNYLENNWKFIEKNNFTEVHFDVDFEIKNKFLNIIMAKSFQFGLNKIADAFQKRAESL